MQIPGAEKVGGTTDEVGMFIQESCLFLSQRTTPVIQSRNVAKAKSANKCGRIWKSCQRMSTATLLDHGV